MADDGWIKIPRKAVKLFYESDKLRAYIHLEMNRTWGQPVKQSISGLALKWDWSRDKARRFLQAAFPLLNPEKPDTQSDTLEQPPAYLCGEGPTSSPTRSKITTPISQPSKGKATPAPSALELTQDMRQWLAKTFGHIPEEIIVRERDNFLDRNRALDKRYIDWIAAWRTWMRNWKKFGGMKELQIGANSYERLEDSPKYQD